MPGEQTLKVPLMVIVAAFVAALLGIVGWVYAEGKASDDKIAELKQKAALTDQTLEALTEKLDELNVTLKEHAAATASQDDTNAMLRELLKQKDLDPDEVILKAKAAKKKKPAVEKKSGSK